MQAYGPTAPKSVTSEAESTDLELSLSMQLPPPPSTGVFHAEEVGIA